MLPSRALRASIVAGSLAVTLLPLSTAQAESPATAAKSEPGPTHPAVTLKAQLANSSETVQLVEQPDGTFRYLVSRESGEVERLTPDQLAAEIYRQQTTRGFWLRLLNITSPVGILWVGLGLLGQVLFAGRMLVQWIASEREKRSVVPPIFWWMSVAGSSLLILYFVWRRDLVGVLGQATGWIIYLRNLRLIHRPAAQAEVVADRR